MVSTSCNCTSRATIYPVSSIVVSEWEYTKYRNPRKNEHRRRTISDQREVCTAAYDTSDQSRESEQRRYQQKGRDDQGVQVINIAG